MSLFQEVAVWTDQANGCVAGSVFCNDSCYTPCKLLPLDIASAGQVQGRAWRKTLWECTSSLGASPHATQTMDS